MYLEKLSSLFGIFLIGIMRRVTRSAKESAETGGYTLGLKSARQGQIPTENEKETRLTVATILQMPATYFGDLLTTIQLGFFGQNLLV